MESPPFLRYSERLFTVTSNVPGNDAGMKRRSFLQSSVLASAVGMACSHQTNAATPGAPDGGSAFHSTFAVDDNRVIFYTDAVTRPVNTLIVADTHLFTDDERGAPYREFSRRMAAGYNVTRHFRTGEPTSPQEGFRDALDRVRSNPTDLLALVGDIFSFPSEAAIDWASGQLSGIHVPWLYVAGNHDWHYEGMPGSLNDLREEWIERRLKPMYQGRHPLMAACEVHDIRFLAIDNSQYEILPEQLRFFREQVRSGRPLILLVHIPLYAPGRPIGFGCGHPDWGAASDPGYELERRPRWPESGHTEVTMDFHREVFESDTLLGIFAGHIHRQSLDVVNGIPQFVTNANAVGAFMDVSFVPAT